MEQVLCPVSCVLVIVLLQWRPLSATATGFAFFICLPCHGGNTPATNANEHTLLLSVVVCLTTPKQPAEKQYKELQNINLKQTETKNKENPCIIANAVLSKFKLRSLYFIY